MRLSISGIGLDKERTVISWVDGRIEGDEFLKSLYDSLAMNIGTRTMSHTTTAISPSSRNILTVSAFFYISRFILKDVKIVEGSLRSGDFVPEGAKA